MEASPPAGSLLVRRAVIASYPSDRPEATRHSQDLGSDRLKITQVKIRL
jgi:hypothetical protein